MSAKRKNVESSHEATKRQRHCAPGVDNEAIESALLEILIKRGPSKTC